MSLGERSRLQPRPPVGMEDLLREQQREQGLAELVTYLSLTDDTFRGVFDDTVREHVNWLDQDDRMRTATLPGVTFARGARGRKSASPDRDKSMSLDRDKSTIPNGATR